MPSWGDRQTMMEEDAALWALLLNINLGGGGGGWIGRDLATERRVHHHITGGWMSASVRVTIIRHLPTKRIKRNEPSAPGLSSPWWCRFNWPASSISRLSMILRGPIFMTATLLTHKRDQLLELYKILLPPFFLSLSRRTWWANQILGRLFLHAVIFVGAVLYPISHTHT